MRSPCILVVENDPGTLRDLSSCLESLGYQVRSAADGPGAIAEARKVQPDLGLLDVHLPGGMDGVEAGDRLYDELGIPVVYLGAFSDDDVAARASRASAYGYVRKPFSVHEVSTIVELALHRHQVERMLAHSEQRFRHFYDQNPAGVIVEAADGRIVECNQALARMLGYDSPHTLRNMPAAILFENPLEDLDRRQRVSAGETLSSEQTQLRHRDGHTVWVADNAVLVPDPLTGRGQILRTVVDITERKQMEEVLERLAYRDPLTGLPNRRLLELRAEQTLAEARRRRERAALLFMDLISFKQVNDHFGHGTGDEVLVQVARRLRGCLRRTDAAARFGGDEFMVLLSGVGDQREAEQAVERVLARISEEPFAMGDLEIRVEVRVGVAIYPDQARTMEGLIQLADGALTMAKARGGAVTVFAPDPEPPPPPLADGEPRIDA